MPSVEIIFDVDAATIEAIQKGVTDVGMVFTRTQLQAAFDRVANPADWKDRIDAPVPAENLAVTLLAIRYFTATDGIVTGLVAPQTYRVQAIGYRLGPAG